MDSNETPLKLALSMLPLPSHATILCYLARTTFAGLMLVYHMISSICHPIPRRGSPSSGYPQVTGVTGERFRVGGDGRRKCATPAHGARWRSGTLLSA